MELLLAPEDAENPAVNTPYVCQEHWDGRPFLQYAHRKNRTKTIPVHLRHEFGFLGPFDGEDFSEVLYPTSREELQPFYQTWFFFGLLAEFLGLNLYPNGKRLVDEATAKKELGSLHDELTTIEDGQPCIKIDKAKYMLWSGLMMERIQNSEAPTYEHLGMLQGCLRFTYYMLHSTRCEPDLDDSIRYSISALGEFFSNCMCVAVFMFGLDIPVQSLVIPWGQNYLKAGSGREKLMLGNGWCISEIGQVREQFSGLNLLHYLSRLEKPIPHRRHERCTIGRCTAFQLDLATYQPAHAAPGCKCQQVGVDMYEVVRILRSTNTFPIISLERSDENDDDITMKVKEYRPGMPYIAISHVWADGLGNPHDNTLLLCQVKKLAGLLNTLQMELQLQERESFASEPYHIWIDPLLCPVEKPWKSISAIDMKNGKKISLQRIIDVYRHTAHVLVLDASLFSLKSQSMDRIEVILRAFACSAWMRRLWTLQEGALAKSLYFQFADGPLATFPLLNEAFQEEIILLDNRYFWLSLELRTEVEQLHGFFHHAYNGPRGIFLDRDLLDRSGTSVKNLAQLQRALYFRSVTVPSDEAICIANLLQLDVGYVLESSDAEARMARVWELISRTRDIPVSVVFLADDTLDIPGWRWAPRTLMGASTSDSVLGLQAYTVRFNAMTLSGSVLLLERNVKARLRSTVPRSLGFKVQLPGWLLKPKPRAEGLPLHPWQGMTSPVENFLIARDEKKGTFVRILDSYRSMKSTQWTSGELSNYDREMGTPLCDAVDSGRCAVLYNPGERLTTAMMVLISDRNVPGHPGALKVRKHQQVMISTVGHLDQFVSERLESFADRFAQEQVTKDLALIKDHESEEYGSVLDKARTQMKDMMAEMWDSSPDFAAAARQTQSSIPHLETFEWAYVPIYHSHHITIEQMPDDQVWIVE